MHQVVFQAAPAVLKAFEEEFLTVVFDGVGV